MTGAGYGPYSAFPWRCRICSFSIAVDTSLCIVVLGKVAVVSVSAATGVLVQTVQNTVWRFSGTVPGQGLHARRVQRQV